MGLKFADSPLDTSGAYSAGAFIAAVLSDSIDEVELGEIASGVYAGTVVKCADGVYAFRVGGPMFTAEQLAAVVELLDGLNEDSE